MKKIFIILLLPFLLGLNGCGHKLIKWNRFNLKYESPEKIRRYRTESKSVLGHDNFNIAVDIEAVLLFEESDEFRSDIKYAANELAQDLSYKEIQVGNAIPNVEKGFYVIAQGTDYNGESYPAVVAVIINEYRSIAFEITIDCYNKDLETGLEIVNSFEFY